MGELTKLQNIGKTLDEQLFRAGIHSVRELNEKGSRAAWLSIRTFDPSACYMRLCALEGAIRGVRWHGLDERTKAELKSFYLANKA